MKVYDVYEGKLRALDAAGTVFEKEYDVVVAGLGVAGAIAALSAAREGLRVFGAERMNAMGGTGTIGGIWSYYRGNKGGLYEAVDAYSSDLVERDYRYENGACAEKNPHKPFKGQSGLYKSEALRILCEQAGVEYALSASVTGVYREGDRVIGVRWFDGKVSHAYASKYVIDCTADGSVCMAAGCEMNIGRETDHAYQPYSNILLTYRGGNLHFANTDSGTLDQYDPLEYGYASMYSATPPMFLPAKFSGANRYIGLAPLLGLREGRTIVGEATIRLDELMDEVAYGEKGDAVFYGMSHVDDHSQDFAYGGKAYCELMSLCGLWSLDFWFGVPMGAMIPKGLDGILASGRIVSMDHAIAQAMRMKDDMQKSGEAAAMLAALAIKGGVPARGVDPEALRKLLRRTGCLKEGDRVKIRNGDLRLELDQPVEGYITDPALYRGGLSSDRPGLFILSARYMPEDFGETLYGFLQEKGTLLSHNAALALAMRGDRRCVPVLLEMLASRDGYTPKSGYYVPDHALAACTAIGLLGVSEAVEQLFRMLDLKYSKGIPFFASYLVQDETALAYEYFTHAHRALLRIAEQHPELAKPIMDRLDAIIGSPDLKLLIGLRATENTMSDRTETTRIVQAAARRAMNLA